MQSNRERSQEWWLKLSFNEQQDYLYFHFHCTGEKGKLMGSVKDVEDIWIRKRTISKKDLKAYLKNPDVIDLLVICFEEVRNNQHKTFEDCKEAVEKYFLKSTMK